MSTVTTTTTPLSESCVAVRIDFGHPIDINRSLQRLSGVPGLRSLIVLSDEIRFNSDRGREFTAAGAVMTALEPLYTTAPPVNKQLVAVGLDLKDPAYWARPSCF